MAETDVSILADTIGQPIGGKDIPITKGVLPVQGEKETVHLSVQELSGPSGGVYIIEIPNLQDDIIISPNVARTLLNKGAIALQQKIPKGSEFSQLVTLETVPVEEVQTDEPYRLIVLTTRPLDNMTIDPRVIEQLSSVHLNLVGMQITQLGDRAQVTIAADVDNTSPFFTKLDTAKSVQSLYRLLEVIHGDPRSRRPYRIDTSDPTRNALRVSNDKQEFTFSVVPTRVHSDEEQKFEPTQLPNRVLESLHAVGFSEMPEDLQPYVALALTGKISGSYPLPNGDTIDVVTDSDGIAMIQRHHSSMKHESIQAVSDFWIIDTSNQKAIDVNKLLQTVSLDETHGKSIDMVSVPASITRDGEIILTGKSSALVVSQISRNPSKRLQDLLGTRGIEIADRFAPFVNIGLISQYNAHEANGPHAFIELAMRSGTARTLIGMIPGVGRKLDMLITEQRKTKRNAIEFGLNVGKRLKEQGVDLFVGTSEREVRDFFNKIEGLTA